MKRLEIELLNETGLHARPASLFVKTASDFVSHVTLSKGERKCDAKSIMGVLSLGAVKGDQLVVEAEGSDEDAAIEAIQKLIENNFGE